MNYVQCFRWHRKVICILNSSQAALYQLTFYNDVCVCNSLELDFPRFMYKKQKSGALCNT